jgi:alcohol-forming fatty acyl-CoA reductase
VIRNTQPQQLEKVKFIEGDIGSDSLISSSFDNIELMNKVNIIFHCAATTTFTAPLKTAINMNTAGTKRLLDFAIKAKNLEVFVYMSTAFSHCYQIDHEERYYDVKLDPFLIMKQMQKMNDSELEKLENEL